MTTLHQPSEFAHIHALAFRESRPWLAAEFEALLQSPYVFWVGDSHGFALGRALAGESELLTIAVRPEFQQKGIGRRLMAAYHEKAADYEAKQFFLEVSKDNIAAINLYKSCDYQTVTSRKDYYTRPDGQRIDALIMARDIA